MRARFKSFLLLITLGISTVSFGQSATWTKNFANEADVRDGTTYYIEVTLVADTFETIIDTNNPAALGFVSGITGSSAWASIMSDIGRDQISLDDNNTKAIISIRQDADYFITADDVLSFTIDGDYLEETANSSSLTVTGNLTVSNLATTVAFSGGLAGGIMESDMQTADQTLILELTNNLWVDDIETDNGARDAIKSMFSGAPEFEKVADDLTSYSGDINLSADERTLTLRFNQDGSYYIPSTETVSVTVPTSLFQTNEATSSSTSFTITNEDPVITITDTTYSESDIQTDDIIFKITISGDIWAADISSIQNSIVTGGEWDTDITPTLLVSRLNDTEVRVEVPQNAAFNIDYDETVSISIPSAAIENTTGGAISVTGNHLVEVVPPGIDVSGSIMSVSDEGSIRSGSHEIVVSLSEDTWVAGVGTNGATNAILVNSITCSPPQAGWDDLLADILAGSNVSTPVAGVVTITVPQKTDFDITDDIWLSINAPASLFTVSTTVLDDDNFKRINRIDPYIQISSNPTPLTEGDLNGAEITVNISEDTLIDNSFDLGNFEVIMSETGDAPYIDAPGDIQYIDNKTLVITLSFPAGYSFSTDRTLGLRILGGELSGGASITSSNTIPVEAVIEPIITSVNIPNDPMGIGATVNVTITVEEDDGGNFEYNGGTVAGRTLTPLVHQGGTTYRSTFTVIENSSPEFLPEDDILVENLQLRNGTALGNSYDRTFSRSGDPLDSRRPDLALINFNNGIYSVGEVITALVVTSNGEEDLEFDKANSSMNSLSLDESNFTFHEAGAGSYQINYEVGPGNNNTSDIPVSIRMHDFVGNTSNTLTTYTGTSPTIFGQVPIISSVEVTSTGIKTHNPPNNQVLLTVTADTRGLVFTDETTVNDVGLASGRIAIDSSLNVYTLTYTIDQGDAEVLSVNQLEATIIMADQAGNEVEFTGTLSSNDVTIFTALPAGNIFGGGNMCDGDSIELFVDLAGRGPFDITVLEDAALFNVFMDVPADFSFYVKPNSDKTYSLFQVTDVYGNSYAPSSITDVTVNPIPVPVITNSRTSYQVSEPAIALEGNYDPDGQFTGPGVVSSERKFYPSVADTTGSPHTIYYTYENPGTGCVGVGSAQFSVLVAQAEILGLTDVICYNEPPMTITGSVIGGGAGAFSLQDQKGNVVPGALVNIGGNQAVLDVESLSRGTYRVVFTYEWNLKPGYIITRDFYLDYIKEVSFENRPDTTVCINNTYTILKTNLDEEGPNFIYEGDGVSYSFSESSYVYNPADAPLDNNRIVYTFTSERGCIRKDSFEIINYDVPNVFFEPEDICIAEEGTKIFFKFDTINKKLVDKWMWYFNDGDASEAENRDTIENLDGVVMLDRISHFYQNPVNRTVSLKVLTKEGSCTAVFDSTIIFGDKPIANFEWNNDCYVGLEEVDFTNLSGPEGITWDSLYWHIYNADPSVLDTSITKTDKTGIGIPFPRQDDYYIELSVWTELGCSDTRIDSLILKPTITPLMDTSYYETFNDPKSKGKWSTNTFSTINSWTYNELDWVYDSAKYNQFEIESGDLSWFITKDDTDETEDSWIQSPCFNFDSLEVPMIRFDMMRSFDETWDGAVLQYTLNNGESWTRLGEIDEGINWYNSFDILSKPGGENGSSIGWSGEDVFSPDTNWVTVAHELDELKGSTGVIFGIFYATAVRTKEDNKGIAVDNVYIGERSKRALIEHFTDSGEPTAASANAVIDNFTEQNPLDVTSLQYHLHYSGEDPMNENNPAPASSRSFYYGISGIPYALMDGGVKLSYQYDFVSTEPTTDQLRELTLESPVFEMELRSRKYNERLATTVVTRALQDYADSDVALYVVVVEEEAEYAGTIYKNVVLDMLPSPAGTVYDRDWVVPKNEGDEKAEETFEWSWRYIQGVDISDDLKIVAFIQERESGKVLQVASQEVIEFGTAIVTHNLSSLRVYPNPASHLLRVEFDEAKFGDVILEVTDMTGRTVLAYELYPGEQHIELAIDELNEGSYILQSKENGRVSSRTNFIKVR